MSHAFRRSLSILLASILCIAPLAAVAATSPLPSLGDADIASAKLQAVYRQADIALDKAIAKAGPNLTTRERWVLTQALAAIEKRFEAIDRALTARDAQAFKSEVSSFKKEYSTIAGFLKTASSRTSTATVDVEPVKPTTSTQTTATATPVTVPIARTIALGRDIFAGLGVKLDTGIPSEYLRGETLHISGIIETADAASLIFLLAPDKQTRFIASLPAENGKFSYSVPLREVGSYSLVIAAGKSFETRNLATITVTDPVAEAAGLPTSSISDVSSFSFERVNFTDLSGVNLMTFDKSDPKTLYTVVVTDSSGHSVTRRGMGSVAFFWDDFTDFEINKPVQVRVTARASVSTSSTDAYTASKVVFNRSMTLSPSYAAKNEIGFDVRTKGNSTVEIVGTTPSDGRTLARELYVIRPDGSVDTKLFDLHVANSADTEVLKTGTEIAYSFDARDEWVYLVEVNYDTGFAAVNVPIVIGSSALPLGTNIIDRMRDEDYSTVDEVDRASLEFLNGLRAQYGLGKLRLSDKLGKLAQIKADDMAANSYVGHVDSYGVYVDGTAERNGIRITKSVSENVAGGNVGYGVLNSALSLSGGHRSNMLGEEWTTVGIGIARSGERAFYVQVFGME